MYQRLSYHSAEKWQKDFFAIYISFAHSPQIFSTNLTYFWQKKYIGVFDGIPVMKTAFLLFFLKYESKN